MPASPGEVFWATVEGRPKRPWVVISRESLNRGAYVLALSCTTARMAERRELPNCVTLSRGDGGVTKDCVVQAELCTCVLREELEAEPLGRLPEARWREPVRALGYDFGASCEPA
ncbi:MAG: type II toxin-antitoxin system PemK/MazF family toxin [Planctomycetales bacterium]|nr:type II toxin-antitoxin system PemK/MazF family toxin [Planctomycetales bacterium]